MMACSQEEAVKDGKDGASSVIPWTVPRNRFGPKDTRPSLKIGRPPSVLDELDGELEKRVLAPTTTEHAPAAARPVASASRLDGKPPQSAAEELAAARVRQLERLLRTQEQELRRQEREISQLQADKFSLQRENREMQLFLADYGMRWVGGAGEASAASSTADGAEARGAAAGVASRAACEAGPSSSSSSSSAVVPAAKGGGMGGGTSPCKAAGSAPMPPDMDVVRRAVQELNELADSSAEVVQRGDGSHRLQQSQPTLSLIFWRNGMEVQGGELRPYGTPHCASFLKDLLDGFFPYELKYAFPDGVTFSVQDRSHVDNDQPEHTWGQGRRLDSRGGGAARGGVAARGGGAGASLLGIDAGRMLSLDPQLAAGGTAAELVAELVAPAPADPAAPTAPAATAAVAPVATPAAAAAPVAAAPVAPAAAPVVATPAAALAAAAAACSSGQAAAGESGESGECRLQIKDSSGGVACVMTLSSKATLAEVHQQLHAHMGEEVALLAARCLCRHPLLAEAHSLAQGSPLGRRGDPAALATWRQPEADS